MTRLLSSDVPDARDRNGHSVRFIFPAWVSVAAKSGLWAMLALALIWQLLLQRTEELRDIRATVVASAQTLDVVKNQIDHAERAMGEAVKARDARDQVMIQLLVQLCVQNAASYEQRQACFAAARER